MEMVRLLQKGTATIKAFSFKRPQKHGHMVLCYIVLYTILQMNLVSARHHELGKLLPVTNTQSYENNNGNKLNILQQQNQQQNFNAQINHSHENEDIFLNKDQKEEHHPPKSLLSQQQPILGQKITQQTLGSTNVVEGAVLSKDDGKLTLHFIIILHFLRNFQI